MKIVFFGTPEFAAYSLRCINEAGYDIAAVVTATDKPAGRSHHLLASAVKQYALEAGLPILQPANLKSPEFIEQLREINADLFVVIAFRMMPEAVWSMPRLGTFNLHASLLPRYRGAAPINWAVINGDTETGVTTFFLKHEIDTGDIIARERVAIGPDDNVGDVYDRLMELGAKLTLQTLKDISEGGVKATPQDSYALEGETPTPAPKIFRDTCHIDWTKPAETVRNLVRGLSPYPGAWSTLGSENAANIDVKIFVADVVAKPGNLQPGQILSAGGDMIVGCGENALKIKELQAQGKRRMTADEFLRGARLVNPHFC